MFKNVTIENEIDENNFPFDCNNSFIYSFNKRDYSNVKDILNDEKYLFSSSSFIKNYNENNQLLDIINNPLIDNDRFIIECTDKECYCKEINHSNHNYKYCNNKATQISELQFSVTIKKTKEKGWGVFTNEFIPKGSFVVEYIGKCKELIEEQDEDCYSFELYTKEYEYYFNRKKKKKQEFKLYEVCATNYGNISAFFNHSCQPNLIVFNVFRGNVFDIRFPHLCFFAMNDILIGEELCFDYGDSYITWMRTTLNVNCKCNSEFCRYSK
ncbi:hypothetical protein ABK040_007510 [Willaertia magna]